MKYGLMISVACLATCLGAAELGYSCSLRVGRVDSDRKVTETGKPKNLRNPPKKQVRTTKQTQSWPVSVSFRGKEIPTSGIKLNLVYLGTTDGKISIMDQRAIDVRLDEKGDFTTTATSPEATLVKTTTARGNWRNRSMKSETTGTRVSGCIMQVVVNGEVVKFHSTLPQWQRVAKTYPLSNEDFAK